MQWYNALIRKELQQYRIFWVVIIAVQFIVTAFFHFAENDTGSKMYVLLYKTDILPFSDFFKFGAFLVIPVLMIYSWYLEENEYTAYQVLSCPVLPATIIKNKFTAFFIIGMAWITVNHFMFLQLGQMLITPRDSVYTYIRALLPYISSILFLFCVLGFSTFLISLGQVIRRYRILTGLLVTLATFWTMGWLRLQLSPLFNYTDTITLDAIIEHPENIMFYVTICVEIMFPSLIGLGFLYLGLFLFERFSEV